MKVNNGDCDFSSDGGGNGGGGVSPAPGNDGNSSVVLNTEFLSWEYAGSFASLNQAIISSLNLLDFGVNTKETHTKWGSGRLTACLKLNSTSTLHLGPSHSPSEAVGRPLPLSKLPKPSKPNRKRGKP